MWISIIYMINPLAISDYCINAVFLTIFKQYKVKYHNSRSDVLTSSVVRVKMFSLKTRGGGTIIFMIHFNSFLVWYYCMQSKVYVEE